MTSIWTPLKTIFVLVQIFAHATSQTPIVEERIITDSEDVLNGVPVDFRYNETHTRWTSASRLSSVPGCPKSDEGYPWVYYGSPPKCFLAGQKGPCEEGQRVFITVGSPFGVCNCDCFDGLLLSSQNEDQFCRKETGSRVWVYMPAFEKCFSLWEQGPCSKDEWVIRVNSTENDTGEMTKCENRTCPSEKIPIERDGKQECGSHFSLFSASVGIASNDCEPLGMSYSKLLKRCVNKIKTIF